MPESQSATHSSRFQRAVFEIAVPFAMALSAMAFAAGLFVQGGFGLVPSLIAGVTLFLVMICAQAAYVSSQRTAQAVERLAQLEAAVQNVQIPQENGAAIAQLSKRVEQFDGMAERIQQLDGMAERIQQFDGMAGHIQQFDRMAEHIDQLNLEVTQIQRDRSSSDPSRVKRLAAEVERIDARQDALRSQLQIESRDRYEDLSAELKMLETLIKQLTESVTITKRAALVNQISQDSPEPENSESEEPAANEAPAAQDEPDVRETAAERVEEHIEEEDEEQAPETQEPEIEEPAIKESPLIDELRQSIEKNRIELYLQPIMTLPQRRVRYYEALTRLRDESGKLLLPKDYLNHAESAGMMSLIDNVMLYRSVQVLRRLSQSNSARGVFCNISAHSLLDPEFFPEFISFMEQNLALTESMYFEFSQSMIEHCGEVEKESLSALASLGFRFSMDQVTNLDLDFQAMQDRGFQFMKIDAGLFLRGMSKANAQIHAADMRSYLERFGIQLIVSKLEEERDLASVLDYKVKLGQGYLFSEPRPVRPEIFDADDEEAAA